jgi:hypothetical protein
VAASGANGARWASGAVNDSLSLIQAERPVDEVASRFWQRGRLDDLVHSHAARCTGKEMPACSIRHWYKLGAAKVARRLGGLVVGQRVV